MEHDALTEYLNSLEREDCYRVDEVLKDSRHEVTQRVFFRGENGAETGPFIRKYIHRDAGIGGAYERIFAAQRAGARFRHVPRIMECYERGEDLAVVMECVRGETLQEFVYQNDPSASLAREVFPGLCDAVTELHEGFDPPLIHRDLKPSNIIVARTSSQAAAATADAGSEECEVSVIDFGIAREYHEGAEADTAHFGTRAFAPPEQFGFGQTTTRSDVYALGMLLYFCLTEEISEPGDRDNGFADAHLPDALRDVVMQATAFDPAARFASAAALKAAFLNACGKAESGPVRASAHVHAASAADTSPASAASTSPASAATAFKGDSPAGSESSVGSGSPAGAGSQRSQAPHVIGRLWNALVIVGDIALCAFILWCTVNGVSNPAYPNPISPAQGLFVACASVPWLLLLGFACLDKRRLRQRFRVLARVKTWQVWSVVAILFVVIAGINRIAFGG